MNPFHFGRVLKLAAAAALAASLAACQPANGGHTGQAGGSNADKGAVAGEISPDKRKLTVVEGSEKKQSQAVSVERIHRLQGANIESWVSDDVLRIMTTKVIKEATATKEAEYSYSTSVIDLTAGDKPAISEGVQKADWPLVKEQVSPDGKFSFIQEWANKYTAKNAIKNLESGALTEIKVPNYMELGGWLDNGHYILAAGDQAGRGDILEIATDGTVTKLQLDDAEVEYFTQFGVSQGYIFYVDKQNVFKKFKPGQSQPETVSKQVSQFEISPDGKHIAAVTLQSSRTSSELMLLGPDGESEGGSLAKGNLLPYTAWSPDSTKLALAVYNEDKNGLNGVYVFDYESGQLSLVGPGYFPEYPLSWSPSGKRLGITISGKDSMPVTQILDFNL